MRCYLIFIYPYTQGTWITELKKLRLKITCRGYVFYTHTPYTHFFKNLIIKWNKFWSIKDLVDFESFFFVLICGVAFVDFEEVDLDAHGMG